MFENKISSGKHMVCDFKDIKNKELLNNTDLLADMMRYICNVCKFQILNEVKHTFNPYGSTILFLLSESHFSLHSFVEKDYVAIDLFTCRQYEDNCEYKIIYNYLLTELEASDKSTYKIIDRLF